MASIFTKIVNGEIPAYKVAEDENYFAFLDIFPVTKGHTLVIPKGHIEHFEDVPDELINEVMNVVKKVTIAVKKATDTDAVN
ncbi:MAG: HIT domain-containing protein, partial [Draconibacterium sp.]|nr:HIT domain-containing protein [Draconibacterium sp.]